jgi:hypothetical protein
MRFAFLVAGGVAAGALSVGGVRTLVPPNAQMFQAVRALGGDMAEFKLGDIDPLKAYENVRRQITSGNLSGSLNLGSAPQITFSKLGDLSVGNKMQLDDGAIRRAIGAGISSQIQQSNRRMEEMSGYTRNPAGWHGMPPH